MVGNSELKVRTKSSHKGYRSVASHFCFAYHSFESIAELQTQIALASDQVARFGYCEIYIASAERVIRLP